MLVSLTVQNWKSFKNETLFTMISTKERKDSSTLAKLPAMYNSRKVLPVAAVYERMVDIYQSFFKIYILPSKSRDLTRSHSSTHHYCKDGIPVHIL